MPKLKNPCWSWCPFAEDDIENDDIVVESYENTTLDFESKSDLDTILSVNWWKEHTKATCAIICLLLVVLIFSVSLHSYVNSPIHNPKLPPATMGDLKTAASNGFVILLASTMPPFLAPAPIFQKTWSDHVGLVLLGKDIITSKLVEIFERRSKLIYKKNHRRRVIEPNEVYLIHMADMSKGNRGLWLQSLSNLVEKYRASYYRAITFDNEPSPEVRKEMIERLTKFTKDTIDLKLNRNVFNIGYRLWVVPGESDDKLFCSEWLIRALRHMDIAGHPSIDNREFSSTYSIKSFEEAETNAILQRELRDDVQIGQMKYIRKESDPEQPIRLESKYRSI
eukprot:185468_1